MPYLNKIYAEVAETICRGQLSCLVEIGWLSSLDSLLNDVSL